MNSRVEMSRMVPPASLGMLLSCLLAVNSQGQSYSVLHYFNGLDGIWPVGGVVLSGQTLYGATGGDGISSYGTLFKVNVDGSNYTVLKNFGWGFDPDGSSPRAGLTLSGTTLYGTTWGGGSSGGGTVFKIGTDGTAYSVLKSFTGSDGGALQAPLALSGTTLYGTTSQGGASTCGTIFKLSTDGTGFTVLKHFAGSDGYWADGVLLVSGSTLYGTTCWGGSFAGNMTGAEGGTVFKINTDGSGFSVLHSFPLVGVSSWGGWTNEDGASPDGALVLSGTTLYGTTQRGGRRGMGTIFRLNTDGSGFAVIKTLDWEDACAPQGLLLQGTTLFGVCSAGQGGGGSGAIFRMNMDGSGYSSLKYFNSGDGAYPNLDPILAGLALYGMTAGGGIGNAGVVFRFSIAPPTILTPPQTQTAELGSAVAFRADGGSQPLTYLWFFDSTNLLRSSSDCVLKLANVQFSQAGAYSVVVTNLFGAATSAPALLNVIPRVQRRLAPAVDLIGEAGSSLHVEYTDALGFPANWLPLDIVNLTNPPQYYVDSSAPLPTQRFYRAWLAGTPAQGPSLRLPSMVPAITLTGNLGDSLRVDYINRFGPTNAWVTLDTVRLTNTSQSYFDLSVIGQPDRLYRVVPVP